MQSVPFLYGFLLLTPLAVVAGCATQPVQLPLSTSHPASPYAAESPVPLGSATLAIRGSEMMPSHPDWQIPGMRDNEINGHAAGKVPMSMMHGMAMGKMNETGEIKMEAAPDEVDYSPANSKPMGKKDNVVPEHDPEYNLPSGGKANPSSESGAGLAPPMHAMKNMHGMDHMSGMSGEKMAPPMKVETKNRADEKKDTQPNQMDDMNGMSGMHHY